MWNCKITYDALGFDFLILVIIFNILKGKVYSYFSNFSKNILIINKYL